MIAHAAHRPLAREGEQLIGSGSVDMKGGVVLSLGVLRALAARPRDYAEVALLLVCDEEWRTAPFSHTERFAGWDACLCFEAGERNADGEEGVVVRRKAAGTLRVKARGRAAHSGSAPDRGRNALLALAAAAQAVAARHDPDGPDHLTAVPTVHARRRRVQRRPRRAASWSATCAPTTPPPSSACSRRSPPRSAAPRCEPEMVRVWPGMDCRGTPAALLERAAAALGQPDRADAGAAARATPATSPPPSRSRSTGSARAAAPPTTPTSSSSRRRWRTRAEVALAVVDAARRSGRSTASDSSSRGRSSATISPWRPRRRTAATPPFLKSTRAPVRSWTTWANDGLWPTTSTLGVAVVAGEQLERVVDLEAVAEHVLALGVDVERLGSEPGGGERAHLRTGVDRGELDPEPREPGAGGDRLPLPARGQLPLVVGLRVVRDGLAVPEEPELPGHGPQCNRPGNCERARRAGRRTTA